MAQAEPRAIHTADEGYDRGEPKSGLIALIGGAIVAVVVVVIFAVQFYYERVKEQQLYEKVMAPIAGDLVDLRTLEDRLLHSYGYVDREAGKVRIPIERAMELLAQEAADNRLPYSTRPTPVKPPEPPPGAPVAAAAGE